MASVSRSRSPVALAVGGMVALAAAMGVGRFVYTPILPLMVESLGLSQGQAGAIASANFAGYLVGALLAAAPVLPGSRRGWFLGALAASAATTALMAAGGSALFFGAVRFLGGVASAFVLVLATALVFERLAGQGRAGLAPTSFAGVGIGIAASSLLMLGLAGLQGGWRTAWLLSGGLSALALVAAAVLIPSGAERAAAAAPAASKGAGRGFLLFALSYGLFGFGYVITATFLVALTRLTPATQPLEPYVWLIVGLSGAPSVAFWIWAGRKVGVYRAYALACLVEAAGVAASVLWLNSFGAIVAAVFLGGTFMGITAVGLAAARALTPGDPRRTLALMTAAFGLGQIIGPSFAGLVHDATGSFTGPSLVAAAALIVAAALAVAVGRSAASRSG